jgi:photosystem II stability/assembly factor-like uncharacterized protein
MKKLLLFVFLAPCAMLTAQPSTFAPRGIGGGGALFAPSINPANTSEFYVACDMSELFHTTDFGQQYQQVHFSEFLGGHNSKVCYTATPNLLYSISYIDEVGTPVASTDNGISWNALAGNPSDDVYTIDVDYNNSGRVIISTYGEIYFSANGGATFTQIHTAVDNGAGNVVAGVFFDGNNIYIGTNDGVLVSTNAGVSWSTATISGLPSNERIWSFCAARSGNTTRFFCLTGDAGDVYVGLQGSDYWGFFQNVYKCDYGVTNWSAASTGIVSGTDFPMFIDMAANDINTVYVAGSNSNTEPDILKTTNAGAGWSRVFNTANNQNIVTGWSGQGGDRSWGYGECPFGFDVASSNANVVIFGDFGFVHKTSDGGASWQQAYVSTADQHPAGASTPSAQSYHSIGLENTTCWQVHWVSSSVMWSCYSDIRGIRSTDSGNSWSFDYTGHTANSSYRVAQSGSTLFMAASGVHDMYQSTRLQDGILDAADAAGKLLYSTNNGQSWQTLHAFNHPVFWITVDPNNANRAYASVIHYNGGAGVGGVYRCNDLNNLASSTWTLLPDPPRTEKHPASLVVLNDGSLVATYSGRRNSNGNFTASSGVFIYDPALNSWTDVSDPDMYYWTKDVVIDPNDPQQNTWYACVFSGWGGPPNGLGGLYKTTNRGASWTKLTGSTLDRVTSCTIAPFNPDEMYITTEAQGLWMSSNINSANPTFSMVTSYPFKQPERVFFNPNNVTEMWVTSFGNGMKIGSNFLTGTPEFTDAAFSIYPNPATAFFTVDAKRDEQLLLYSTTGALVMKQKMTEGQNRIDVSALAAGIYFAEIGGRRQKLVVE